MKNSSPEKSTDPTVVDLIEKDGKYVVPTSTELKTERAASVFMKVYLALCIAVSPQFVLNTPGEDDPDRKIVFRIVWTLYVASALTLHVGIAATSADIEKYGLPFMMVSHAIVLTAIAWVLWIASPALSLAYMAASTASDVVRSICETVLREPGFQGYVTPRLFFFLWEMGISLVCLSILVVISIRDAKRKP